MTSGQASAIVESLGADAFDARLAGTGLGIRIGPFDTFLQADAAPLRGALYRLYRHYPLLPEDAVFSFHARLEERGGRLPGSERLVRFSVDGRVPHEDMPAGQALAVLEWGLNLVIALRAHHLLMLHAAVVERGGRALVMPAEPGFGKTTLCAALACRGWRLFSDEFGMVRLTDKQLLPVPRPLALKNASVDLIRSFSPAAEIGAVIPGTRKGDVAHLKAPQDAIERMQEPAPASLVVFPRWQADAACRLERVSGVDAFMLVATNAFNYELLGEDAFDAVAALVRGAECYRLVYSDLDEAVAAIDELAARGGR